MFKYKVIVLLRKFQLYTYNWNWWKKIHSCMPLNFFLYSAKKDSVWRNKNFRVFLVLCYIRKLASLKIFHLQKALLLDITQKQKRKNNWLFFRFEQHRKKIHSNDKFWLNWLYIAMMLFRENSRTSFPASLNCLVGNETKESAMFRNFTFYFIKST